MAPSQEIRRTLEPWTVGLQQAAISCLRLLQLKACFKNYRLGLVLQRTGKQHSLSSAEQVERPSYRKHPLGLSGNLEGLPLRFLQPMWGGIAAVLEVQASLLQPGVLLCVGLPVPSLYQAWTMQTQSRKN